MASLIFKPSNRLFASGSIGLIIVAVLHTFGHFAPPPNNDAALEAVVAAMRDYQFDLGIGMKPSTLNILESLSLTMTITVLFLGIQNLLTLAIAGDHCRLVRRLTLLSIICTGALVALYTFYRVPPPLISFAVVEVIFILAWLRHRQPEISAKTRVEVVEVF
jgi:hypothetical protein